MTNTETYFSIAKDFQDKRRKLRNDQAAELSRLERYKGSAGYQKDLEAIREKYARQLTGLKSEYKDRMENMINAMSHSLEKRSYAAPSDEQLRLLQTLQMMKSPTDDDFKRYANSLQDCPVALMVLQEKADSCGMMRNYINGRCRELPSKMANEFIDGLRKGTADFLEHDTKRAARVAAARNEKLYGVQPPELPLRDTFTTEKGCFAEISGMDEAAFSAFAAVVN